MKTLKKMTISIIGTDLGAKIHSVSANFIVGSSDDVDLEKRCQCEVSITPELEKLYAEVASLIKNQEKIG